MKQRISQQGSALVYILIAIALMGALTASFMNSDSQQSRSQNAFKLASTINAQINVIRSSIDECVLLYPAGDDNLVVSAYKPHNPYPMHPSSSYFDGSSRDGIATRLVKDISCPGNPGDSNEHTPIFGSSKNLPPPPPVLNDWVYFNWIDSVMGATNFDGVYVSIGSDNTDPYIVEAFNKVDSQYAACEVDVVTSAADDCDFANCLRYWILRVDPACP
jgi:type II secretory pathway pseudopilin PulG